MVEFRRFFFHLFVAMKSRGVIQKSCIIIDNILAQPELVRYIHLNPIRDLGMTAMEVGMHFERQIRIWEYRC